MSIGNYPINLINANLPFSKYNLLNYQTIFDIVNNNLIIKLQNDMINHHIKWGIFVSFNSGIQGMKEFDFHVFNHNITLVKIKLIF